MRLLAAALLAATEPAVPKPIAPLEEASPPHVHPHLAWTQVYTLQARAMPDGAAQMRDSMHVEQ